MWFFAILFLTHITPICKTDTRVAISANVWKWKTLTPGLLPCGSFQGTLWTQFENSCCSLKIMGLRVRPTPLPKHISSCITLVLGYLAVLSLSPFICKTKMIIYIAVRIKVCLAHSSHTSCSYYGILSSRKKQEWGIVGQMDNLHANILKSGFPKKAPDI